MMLASAAGAAALTPRNQLILRGDALFEDMVPLAFGGWEMVPSNALVLPDEDPDSLTRQLYSETVSRLYMGKNRIPVMLVIAYGDTQSDRLQLHRPEVCYVAVGFEVGGSRRVEMPLVGDEVLPMRGLVARNSQRVEPILYWTRIGDHLPTTGNEQRMAKIRTALDGYVSDGVLVRMSTVGEPTDETFDALEKFAGEMIRATNPAGWPGLVGRPLATAMIDAKGAA
jgi:EpsI family protein